MDSWVFWVIVYVWYDLDDLGYIKVEKMGLGIGLYYCIFYVGRGKI